MQGTELENFKKFSYGYLQKIFDKKFAKFVVGYLDMPVMQDAFLNHTHDFILAMIALWGHESFGFPVEMSIDIFRERGMLQNEGIRE